ATKDAAALAAGASLNELMAAGSPAWTALRAALSRLLRRGARRRAALESCLLSQAQAEYGLPAHIGDYTDFYTSIHHATAVGRLLRPGEPLLPNYKWLPVAYHGRCSSIGVSGEDVRRPVGQILERGASTLTVPMPAAATASTVRATGRLDYEVELGAFIGPGNPRGARISLADAESHVFGLCLLNDWSARDIQAFEYQPLGPFLAKSFATTLSPWVVTLAALAPYRLAWDRPAADPAPHPYLDSKRLRASGAIDITLEAYLDTASMWRAGAAPWRLSRTSYRHAYWKLAQMVAHHSVGGCNLRPGDLLATGTQSGPLPGEAGSLLELSAGGRRPLRLANGETRCFLEDGDRVILRGYCARPGAARIGFGEAAGRVLAAVPLTPGGHPAPRSGPASRAGTAARRAARVPSARPVSS
ncbi:MAG: fumarylacetoacetase, partial [Steroidobacteraceae bacterium]